MGEGNMKIEFESEFELKFNIKTNVKNIEEILEIITKNIREEMDKRVKDKTEIECTAEIKNMGAKIK